MPRGRGGFAGCERPQLAREIGVKPLRTQAEQIRMSWDGLPEKLDELLDEI